MDQSSGQRNVGVDPIGQALFEEVLQRPVFDETHPPPLVGVREYTINHLFAHVWSRSNEENKGRTISLRERRLITIALLAAQGRGDQLKEHVTGASRAGLKEEELLDVMIHVAHYAGWAAGTSGQSTVQHVFEKGRLR